MVKYCNYCGKQNSDDVNFCIDCGRKLPINSKKTIEDKKDKKHLNFILIGILVFVIGISSTFMILNLNDNSNITQLTQQKSNDNQEIKTTSYSNQPVYTSDNTQTCPQSTTSSQTCDYSSYQSQINTLNTKIDNCNQGYIEKENELENTKSELDNQQEINQELYSQLELVRDELDKINGLYAETKNELWITHFNLLKTQAELNYTMPIVERFKRGINLKEHYKNLGDYDDNVEHIVLEYLQLDKPQAPKNDYELWQRAKMIYNWISYRFSYCGDRDILLGGTYTHFQFDTPDELLSNDNHWCNDCDGFATLFAGMMYASGVPEDKVIMVCGNVETGGHCWNWVKVENRFYTIDSVCSQGKYLEEVWGIPLWWKDEKQSYPFSSTYDDVKCFKEYTPTVYLTPSKYQELKNEIKE